MDKIGQSRARGFAAFGMGQALQAGGAANCSDNCAVERAFKSLRAELVWRRTGQTRQEVEVALFDDINGGYCPVFGAQLSSQTDGPRSGEAGFWRPGQAGG